MTPSRPTVQQTARLLDLLETVVAEEEVRDPAALRQHLETVCHEQGVPVTARHLDQAVSRYMTETGAPSDKAAAPASPPSIPAHQVSWERPSHRKEHDLVVARHRALMDPSWRSVPRWLTDSLLWSCMLWLIAPVVLSLLGVSHPFATLGNVLAFFSGAVVTNFLIRVVSARWPNKTRRLQREAFMHRWHVAMTAGADAVWEKAEPTAEQWARWLKLPTLAQMRQAFMTAPKTITRRDIDLMEQHAAVAQRALPQITSSAPRRRGTYCK